MSRAAIVEVATRGGAPTRTLRGFAIAFVAWLVAGAVLPHGAPLGVVLLGVVLGGLSALTALGLVLIYRAARIINFAQAEIGGLAAAVATVMVAGWHLPYFLGLAVGLLAALATGALIDSTVVRRFFTAPRLILTVATIGVAQILGAGEIALPTFFHNLQLFETFRSPFRSSFTVGPIVFTGDHVVAIVVVPVVLAGLAFFLGRSDTGIAIRAAAESGERALLLGIPVRRLSRITWMLAAGLSGIGSMLAAPIIGTNLGIVAGPESLLVPLAAAVVARMERLGVAVVAAVGIEVVRQLVFWSYPQSSTVDVAVFVLVLVALLVQRRGIERVSGADSGTLGATAQVRPLPAVLRSMPLVGAGWRVGAIGLAVIAVVVPAGFGFARLNFLTTLVIYGILAISLVVLSGWSGQLSLGQFALAGIGGASAAALLVSRGADLFLAIGVAMIVAGLAAVAVGLPALRMQGLFFAVTTLALSVPVATWLLNPSDHPTLTPPAIARPVLFGRFTLDSPLRFYYLCLAAFACTLIVAGNVRNSRAGRVILGVRDNERAAASFSVNASRTRLVAFALSGAIAGLAGSLYVVALQAVPFNGFSPTASIQLFSMVVIGGLGSIPGAILGAAYVWSAEYFLSGAAQLLATGAGLLVLLMFIPGGLGDLLFRLRDAVLRVLARRQDLSVPGLSELFEAKPAALDAGAQEGATPGGTGLLSVKGVTASYGRVPVLFGVDLDVADRGLLALLGTNGAGKSTILRVVSGLLPATGGSVEFDGTDITRLSPSARVRLGLVTVPGGRGVFGGLTVEENLRAASWTTRHDTEFVNDTIRRVLEMFPHLRERMDQKASLLSGGEQQMLTISQALLCRPRLLLIDELSLGLAPAVVAMLVEVVKGLAEDGVAMVIVEQSVNVSTKIADHAVFLERGQVRFAGPTRELETRPDLLRSVFFGKALKPAKAAPPRAAQGRDAARAVTDPSPSVHGLELVGLAKSFGGVTALRDVTLRAAGNEILGIIGANGAGKTTLFDVASGFLAPDAGRIILNGIDVTRRAPDERAELGLGRVFQDARLFPSLTVIETISIALERHIAVRDPFACALGLAATKASEREVAIRVAELIELTGLERYADAFIGELSTGTRRVVEIACAMAHHPKVLLLDEPSSGIAQRESEALAELLLQLRSSTEATFLIIEHDIPLVSSISDRLVCMDLGAPLTSGTPHEVLTHPDVVAAYLGTDSTVIRRSGGAARPRRVKASATVSQR